LLDRILVLVGLELILFPTRRLDGSTDTVNTDVKMPPFLLTYPS